MATRHGAIGGPGFLVGDRFLLHGRRTEGLAGLVTTNAPAGPISLSIVVIDLGNGPRRCAGVAGVARHAGTRQQIGFVRNVQG